MTTTMIKWSFVLLIMVPCYREVQNQSSIISINQTATLQIPSVFLFYVPSVSFFPLYFILSQHVSSFLSFFLSLSEAMAAFEKKKNLTIRSLQLGQLLVRNRNVAQQTLKACAVNAVRRCPFLCIDRVAVRGFVSSCLKLKLCPSITIFACIPQLRAYTHTQARTNTFPFAVLTFPTYTAVLMTKSRLFVKVSTISEPTEKNYTKHKSRLIVYKSESRIFRIQRRINIST